MSFQWLYSSTPTIQYNFKSTLYSARKRLQCPETLCWRPRAGHAPLFRIRFLNYPALLAFTFLVYPWRYTSILSRSIACRYQVEETAMTVRMETRLGIVPLGTACIQQLWEARGGGLSNDRDTVVFQYGFESHVRVAWSCSFRGNSVIEKVHRSYCWTCLAS